MDNGRKCLFAVDMRFDRFEEKDSQRCIFRESPETASMRGTDAEFNAAYTRQKYGNWKGKIDLYMGAYLPDDDVGRFDLPPYVLSINGTSNDTELPNLQVDYASRELSFEWEGMFSKFCHEEVELGRINAENVQAIGREGVPDIGTLGAEDGANAMMAVIKRWYDLGQSSRKRVRRQRAQRFFSERGHFEYEDVMFDEEEEERQLKRIEDAADVGRDVEEDDGEEMSLGGGDEDDGSEDEDDDEDMEDLP